MGVIADGDRDIRVGFFGRGGRRVGGPLRADGRGGEGFDGGERRRDENLMNEDAKWLFSGGTGPHASFGFCAGSDPDPNRVEEAAKVLGRSVRFIDEEGYQVEMFAASFNSQTGVIAYVESRARQLSDMIDVNFGMGSAGRITRSHGR